MKSLLVVVDGTERTNHTLGAAVARADRANAGLVVLQVTPDGEYRRKQRAVASVPGGAREGYQWTIRQAEDSARRVAERWTRVAVGDRDVDWTAVGRVGTPADVALAVAAEYDCDELVVGESKPGWFGLRKGLDGKLAGAFAGAVTAVPEPAVGSTDGVSPVPEPEV